MTSDREWLRERLKLVEEWLANPDREFVYEGEGRGRRRTHPSHRRDTTRHREARLLRKLLAKAPEGRVLKALKGWRRELGDFLVNHRRRYKKQQEAYDKWWQLPPYRRESVPQPKKPPPPRYIDRDGAPWIIDDCFLALLDDLIERLQKGLGES